MSRGFSEDDYDKDALFDDFLEKLPGGWFIDGKGIYNFFSGKPFEVLNADGLPVQCVRHDLFNDYFEAWENFHYFGLPENRGWINELPWLLDFLKFFQRIHYDIKNWK